jgi:hypothetical protein
MHQYGVRRLGLFGSMLPHHQHVGADDERDGKQSATFNRLGSFVSLLPSVFKFLTLFAGHR